MHNNQVKIIFLIFNLPEEQQYDTTELFSRIAAGDEKAFAVLFHRYKQKIYALAYHLTESTVYAEEIVQDVFVKIWRNQSRILEIENFESYLFITARNHIYAYLKAIARHEVTETDINIILDNKTPETNYLAKEYAHLITQAVLQLPAQQAEVYCLSKEEGNTREQIAARLGISGETVKVHLSRAMKTIRSYLLKHLTIFLLGLLAVFK